METTDQMAEETRSIIKILQESARRVRQIQDLLVEATCEMEVDGNALEEAARKLAEEWEIMDSLTHAQIVDVGNEGP